MSRSRLLSFEFLSLCTIVFLALCNVAVFYNFNLYLHDLGIQGGDAGLLIGMSSLASMTMYLTASGRITIQNGFFCMLTGICLVATCGVAYLTTQTFWALAVVRIVNGVGSFMIMAAAMVILVSIIPPDRIGAAFSLYSVALLLPYSIMPVVAEQLSVLLDSPAMVYLVASLVFIPAAGLVLVMRRRVGAAEEAGKKVKGEGKPGRGALIRNVLQRDVLTILAVNCAYFIIFSGLFFLFQGFGKEQGVAEPGVFFSILMGVMISIRLVGGRIFDVWSKVGLVVVAMLFTGAGFALLLIMPDSTWVFPIAVVFGLGMGLCVPPLNVLMYQVSAPEFRGYNANMLMLAVHCGSFLGPVVGGWLIEAGGYDLFFRGGMGVTAVAAGVMLAVRPGCTRWD